MPHVNIRPSTVNGTLQARPKVFVTEGKGTRGIGLFQGQGLVQFLTPEQALRLAHQIADCYAQTQKAPNA